MKASGPPHLALDIRAAGASDLVRIGEKEMTDEGEAEIDACSLRTRFSVTRTGRRELDYLGLKAYFTAQRGPSMSSASHVAL